MIAVLLPVKRFADSKRRLASWLTPEERELLARTMFEDVWETLLSWHGREKLIGKLIVITAEPVVIARCREASVTCLEEDEQVSHTESTRQATRWAVEQGVRTLISVPIDTPAVSPDELTQLVELSRQYEVIVVPSGDGTGTNALVRTPPDAITAHFGPDSCRRHLEDTQTNHQKLRLYAPPGLTADIDTREEAMQFLEVVGKLEREGRTSKLLRRLIETRSRVTG